MSAIKESVQHAIKDAMRAKEKDRLTALRMLSAAFKQIEVDERIELDDARCMAVITKLIKRGEESAAQFDGAGRAESAEKERSEIQLFRSFLPQPLSDAEVQQRIQAAIQQSGAKGPTDMGLVMAILKSELQGRADMSAVSRLVKTELASA
ncbi:MAG: GatB/YqeY domain-containing protein [Pseudomonadota bacterium]